MDSPLKVKSDQNFNLAENIIKGGGPEFSPSVHCCYYSCFQLLLHIQRSHFMMTEAEIGVENHRNVEDSGKSHINLIGKISNELDKIDWRVSRNFKTKIKQLKGLRVAADYSNIEIKEDKAKQAIHYAKEITFALRKNFNL